MAKLVPHQPAMAYEAIAGLHSLRAHVPNGCWQRGIQAQARSCSSHHSPVSALQASLCL